MAKQTVQEQMAMLEAQRKTLALKIADIAKKESERVAKEQVANRLRIGTIAETAGIAGLTDAALLEAFKAIKANKHNVTKEVKVD